MCAMSIRRLGSASSARSASGAFRRPQGLRTLPTCSRLLRLPVLYIIITSLAASVQLRPL